MLKDTARPDSVIRPATAADLPAIAHLCAVHAAFERAGPVPVDLATRLEPVLFSAHPRAWCLVADHGGELIGYVTCSREFSTWQANIGSPGQYVHYAAAKAAVDAMTAGLSKEVALDGIRVNCVAPGTIWPERGLIRGRPTLRGRRHPHPPSARALHPTPPRTRSDRRRPRRRLLRQSVARLGYGFSG
ncbi:MULTISPECIES: SDR family oxidoreductase [unclassified Streptomyces]|uniref:SDR family oxidoreductase n=1 Tax=unclassified Streptomyces TaxID=2593676 RepID=UPI003867696A